MDFCQQKIPCDPGILRFFKIRRPKNLEFFLVEMQKKTTEKKRIASKQIQVHEMPKKTMRSFGLMIPTSVSAGGSSRLLRWYNPKIQHTLDGSEIRQTHQLRLAVYPSIPLLAGFYTSQVMQDIFHQQ